MKNFILGSVIAFLFCACAYFYIENNSLSASLDTFRDNKEVTNKDFQKVKEDYFIQQQSDNVSLILFTVTILFTIFAAVTFIGVKSEFHSAIKKNDKRYDSYKAEYDKSVIHINNLRSNFSFQFADKINDNFGNTLREIPLNIPNLIEWGLMSCQNYCYAIGYNSDDTGKFRSIITEYINVTLDVMVEKVNSVERVELKNIDYDKFLAIKSSFDLTLDIANLQKFSIIFSKLSFPTLD